jgi:hypothetical protein
VYHQEATELWDSLTGGGKKSDLPIQSPPEFEGDAVKNFIRRLIQAHGLTLEWGSVADQQ